MKRRSLIISLFGIMLIAVLALGGTLIAGRTPLLGLDLQGGVSVVLQPHGSVSDSQLQTAVDIIDRRVNSIGVANSTVERQGKDVVIELPGTKNSNKDIKIIGQTAQLFFRPVDCEIPAFVPVTKSTTTTTPKATPTTTPRTSTTKPGSSTPTTARTSATTTKTPATTARTSSTTAKSAAGVATPAALTAMVTRGVSAAGSTSTTGGSATTTPKSTTTTPPSATPTTTTTTGGASTTTTPASTATTTPTTTPTTTKTTDQTAYLSKGCTSAAAASIPNTSPDNDVFGNTVVVPSSASSGYGTVRWILGPADLKGEIVKTASAAQSQTGDNVVNVTLTGSGLAEFNSIAEVRNKYYVASASSQPNPLSQEAIELDGQLESAPTIDSSVFTGPVQISGAFTSGQASNLATELRYGSLPVRFTIGNINTVSATLGRSSLRAGLLAGLGGIILVLLYMILYYRALGLVVVLGLGVGGALLYSILTELSYTSGLALTLSGITGVIVSIGITVDSYVVYFERLKDEVRQGKTVRSSVERGFTRAFKTVLTADLVSFMAALILYLFTVGDVKGFAFTLGLSTILDVFTAYFFIRPIVILLGRRRTTSETGFLGIARGLGAARSEELR